MTKILYSPLQNSQSFKKKSLFSTRKSLLPRLIAFSLIFIGLVFLWNCSWGQGFRGAIWWLTSGEKTSLLFFQNTHELRATGGFMGSYAIIKTRGLKIIDWQTYDIYEGDRYSDLELPAPTGVFEYLADGGSWGLADANWDSDWSVSVATIETMMRAAHTWPEPDLVAAVNLAVAENILDAWGGIYLPDYSVTVTSENFASVVRAERTEWFVGSHQKQNFLQHFASQLRYRLVHASYHDLVNLAKTIWNALENHQIQLLSSPNGTYQKLSSAQLDAGATTRHLAPNFSTLQRFFDARGWSGRWPNWQQHRSHHQSLPVLWVESNVSINKANRYIARAGQITRQNDGSFLIEMTLTNHHPEPTAEELAEFWRRLSLVESDPDSLSGADLNNRFYYADYQRLIFPAEYQISSIYINGQLLENFDQTLISNQGSLWRQIGWLTVINEGQSTHFQITIMPSY